MQGVIYRIVADRGFGFIRGDDGLSRFFHCRQVDRRFDLLKEGMKVEFTSVEDPRAGDNKLRAVDVEVLN